MKIEHKYNLGEEVYYLHYGENYFEINLEIIKAISFEHKSIFYRFSPSGHYVDEKFIYNSKKEIELQIRKILKEKYNTSLEEALKRLEKLR